MTGKVVGGGNEAVHGFHYVTVSAMEGDRKTEKMKIHASVAKEAIAERNASGPRQAGAAHNKGTETS